MLVRALMGGVAFVALTASAEAQIAPVGVRSGGAAQRVQQKPSECTDQVGVTGRVRDEDGNPVVDAVVTVLGRPAASTTQSDGRFELRCLGGVGELRLSVDHPKFELLRFALQAPAIATVDISLTLIELMPGQKREPEPPPAAPEPPADGSVTIGRTAAPVNFTRPGTSGIIGQVQDDNGTPVAGVRLEFMGSPYFTFTDPAGRFRLGNVPLGPYLVRVRKIGYAPQLFSLQLNSKDVADLSIRLSKATGLDTVRVIAQKDFRADRLRGFYERKEKGFAGQFIEEKEIRDRRPFNMSDLLRGRPSILVSRDQNGGTVVFGRNIHIVGGFCPMALFIDGVPLNRLDGYIDRYVPIDAVKAIEIYPTATQVPMEFQRQESGCGAVVVWTR